MTHKPRFTLYSSLFTGVKPSWSGIVLLVLILLSLVTPLFAQVTPSKQEVELLLQRMTPEEADRKLKELGLTREEALRRAKELGVNVEDYLSRASSGSHGSGNLISKRKQ